MRWGGGGGIEFTDISHEVGVGGIEFTNISHEVGGGGGG